MAPSAFSAHISGEIPQPSRKSGNIRLNAAADRAVPSHANLAQSQQPGGAAPPRVVEHEMAGSQARLVVLVSGTGSNLQALLDACADESYGARVVAVGADRDGCAALDRARSRGIPTFTHRVKDFSERTRWDRSLARSTAAFEPDLVISAGFMKLVGPAFLTAFGGRFINTHPALLPSFPGMHGVRDALAYGVTVTGCTIFLVDAGVDDGPVIAQQCVPVRNDDDEASLHERIKVAERALLVATVGRMVREGWTVEGRKVRFGR
jgi:phosphoribosylglycinamide formyltransferase-1